MDVNGNVIDVSKQFASYQLSLAKDGIFEFRPALSGTVLLTYARKLKIFLNQTVVCDVYQYILKG